jgi:hypothetical protein
MMHPPLMFEHKGNIVHDMFPVNNEETGRVPSRLMLTALNALDTATRGLTVMLASTS